MRIGVPTEVKSDEYRVALLPVGVEELCSGAMKFDPVGRWSRFGHAG